MPIRELLGFDGSPAASSAIDAGAQLFPQARARGAGGPGRRPRPCPHRARQAPPTRGPGTAIAAYVETITYATSVSEVPDMSTCARSLGRSSAVSTAAPESRCHAAGSVTRSPSLSVDQRPLQLSLAFTASSCVEPGWSRDTRPTGEPR
jgi:hypothetical protein